MKYILITALFFSLAGATLQAQSKDTAVNRQIIESQNYIFKAQNTSPLRGGTRHLTSDYDLAVKKDSIISWLPYFGRAYSVPLNPSQGALEFTSSKFEYKVEKKKKHSWEITINPKDQTEVRELILTVFDNGSAQLRVNSINREAISLNGYVVAGGQ
jgi:Domain of unknown function (DUF4251)